MTGFYEVFCIVGGCGWSVDPIRNGIYVAIIASTAPSGLG